MNYTKILFLPGIVLFLILLLSGLTMIFVMENSNALIAFLIIVLGLGVLAVFARSSNDGVKTPTPAISEEPSINPTVVSQQISVVMHSANPAKYSQNGSAIIEETNSKVLVTINVSEIASIKNPQPAVIRMGSCANPGQVVYPLSDVVNGKSITTLNVKMTELLSKLPLAISIHQSQSQINTYTSCGDILPNP